MKFTENVRVKLRVLDFDIECRPLSWIGGDFVSREVTAIACRFLDERTTNVWLLGHDTYEEMLEGFVAEYNKADMVTGHYIRGYDLPVLNSALMEAGMPLLESKMSHDTKNDLIRSQGVSKSQESLGQILGIPAPKVHMGQQDWRDANRLTPDGIERARQRVMGDVKQHIQMREELLARKLLGPPRLWKSSATQTITVTT